MIKIPENIAERYVSAVERETERSTRYNALFAAQLAHAQAKRVLEEAEYAVRIAQAVIDDLS